METGQQKVSLKTLERIAAALDMPVLYMTGAKSPASSRGVARLLQRVLPRVEVVELERIPPTMNVIGSYDVELDAEGTLVGYERVRRYHRGQVDEDAG